MALEGLTLLVVEDDAWVLADIQRALETAGATTICTANMEEGLAAANGPIDAAVLDLQLGDEFAYPIANRLKERKIPIVFHSARSELEKAAAAYPDAKALFKPANDRLLTQSIRECVEKPDTDGREQNANRKN